MIRSSLGGATVLLVAMCALVHEPQTLRSQDKTNSHPKQGGGIVIELENAFIRKYMNRATIESVDT